MHDPDEEPTKETEIPTDHELRFGFPDPDEEPTSEIKVQAEPDPVPSYARPTRDIRPPRLRAVAAALVAAATQGGQ